jgi:Fur family zinc uptake transcriptional regulator
MVSMTAVTTEDYFEIAKVICERAGSRLTDTRQHMLEVLLEVNKPLSAYEITEEYNQLIEPQIKTMSVYRILDFLESVHLVHRLQSINKYVVCNHSLGSCQYHPPLYLICKSCQHIEEVELADEVINTLTGQAKSVGFSSVGSQVELYSLCTKCKATIN